MNNNVDVKANLPKWYSTVVIIAIVWNVLGVIAFFGQVLMSAETLASLPEAEQALYASTPLWVNIIFAIAVFAGLLGSVLLLLKNVACYPILLISLIAVLIQMFHSLFLTDVVNVLGLTSVIMPIFVIVIAFLLAKLAAKGINNRWFEK